MYEGSDAADRERLRGLVDMLVQMGFELTLCQKAVGQFGDDMSAAVAWLTDDAAQQQQRQALRRSPSWQRAEELSAMGFSISACKRALEKCSNDANAAAIWLLDHGAEVPRSDTTKRARMRMLMRGRHSP